MKIKLFLVLTFSLLFLVGCASSKQMIVVKKKEYPVWYMDAPKSTATDLYAVGFGQNRQDAITDALTQMISTLGVSVSSKFNAKTVVKEGSSESYDATYTNDSTSEVKQIRISNYELIESQNLGYKKYIVLVKSNKKKLFESMKAEIEQDFKMIAMQEKVIKKQNMLKQLQFYKKSFASLSLLKNELIVMQELQAHFDTSIYLDKYNQIHTKYENVYSSISFSFESNVKNLEAPLAKGISAKKLKISSASGKGHFLVLINADIQRANAYGFTLARSIISIQVKDSRGQVIGSNKINLVGQSTQGYKIAKQNISIKLDALIKKEGISKVLGISI